MVDTSRNIRDFKNIRRASIDDISRIAEILVFSKRKNYRQIFNNDIGSFVELQVCPLAKEYADKPEMLSTIFVYSDEFVKGMIHIEESEVKELYVDPFFEGKGIGSKLIEFAKDVFGCSKLWVLCENEKAKKFYKQHGFYETDEIRPVSEVPNSSILETKMLRNI